MASTVLDVSVFMLCVAGSVLLLGTAGGPPPAEPEPAADRVAATTAAVDYATRPRGPNGTAGPSVERTAHGTLAGLLARAAVADVTVDGRPLSPAADAFVAAVTGTVRGRLPPRTSVVAIYEPYSGSSVRGTVRVGRTPPTDAAVRGTTLTVPTAPPAPPAPRTRPPNASTWTQNPPDGTALTPAAVARVVLLSLLPRRPPTAAGSDRRYLSGRCARLAAALGVDARETDPVDGPETPGAPPDAADGLGRAHPCADPVAERLRGMIERELAADPDASAADRRTTPDRVRVVVRTW